MSRPTKILCGAVAAIMLFALLTAVGLEASRRAAKRARAKAEPWREVAGWEGTKLGATAGVPAPVVSAFAEDPPAPEARKQTFGFALNPGTATLCVGWFANFENVAQNADGWEVTVKVSSHLKSLRGGVPFSPASTTETWQVSRQGRATFLRCDAGPGDTVMFID